MARAERRITKGAHIKRNTHGTSNEISFSVLDAARNTADAENPMDKDDPFWAHADEEVVRRKRRRRARRARSVALMVAAGIAVVALAGAGAWWALQASQQTQGELDRAVALVEEADEVILPFDELAVEGMTADLSAMADDGFRTRYEQMTPQLDEALADQEGELNVLLASCGRGRLLRDGVACAIVGRPNAGKSTLLNAVAGVWPVDEGSITIGGVDVTRLPEHKRAKYIGRVFQDPMMGTAATMQIEENMALAARRGRSRTLRPGITRDERDHYREMLKILDLGLEDRLTSKVGLLSGGQRQALTLLMATLQKPQLLLLDEHTAALDPKTAAKVLEATERIVQKDHLTTLMITHNMRDAIVHGNRLIMMYEGNIALDISGEDKKKLTVEDLLARFGQATGSDEADDKLLLG